MTMRSSRLISFYLRVAAIIAATVFYSVIAWVTMLFAGRKSFYWFTVPWSSALLKAAGVKVEIINPEYLSGDGTFVFVSNHSSLFDIPILLSSIKKNVAIIYKKELEKIPVLGWTLALSPFIPVVRSDSRDSLAGINTAIEQIKNGDSIIVFPEGTRSEDGKLQAFKRGAFMIAARSGKPIVPIAIKGANEILQKGSLNFNSGTVSLIVMPPIPNDNMQNEKLLMKEIENAIRSKLEE